MSAHNKMAEIVEYVSGKFPSIALDKKWNRLVSDMSKEIEILEDAAEHSAHPTLLESAPLEALSMPEHSATSQTDTAPQQRG